MRLFRPSQLLTLWILLCAYLNIAGWVLSAMHALNAVGYAGALLIGVGLLAYAQKSQQWATRPLNWAGMRWRFRHALPACFLVIAALVFVGGALYAPNNYDALTYRIPRVLNWLDKGSWHWIETLNVRMNTRAAGFEWLMAPLLALTRTTRFIFLINFISFLFLPGLLFQVFRLLGVRGRVAWNWMWVLPTGYLYVLQAGSAGNDILAAVFFLASLGFALRAKSSQRFGDVALSIICIALTTGAKQTNLPLGLPWLVALWPALTVLWRNKLRTVAVAAVAAMISYLPFAVINHTHGKGLLGVESHSGVFLPMNIVAAGNTIQLAAQNFAPPVLPTSKKVEAWLKSEIPTPLLTPLVRGFEGRYALSLGELQIEEGAGIGCGVSLLVLGTLGYAAKRRIFGNGGDRSRLLQLSRHALLVVLAGCLAFLLVMGKSQMSTLGRVLAAYYPLVFVPVLLLAATDRLVRRKSWTIAAIISACLSVLVVVVTPARPLWPAQTVLAALTKNHRGPAAVQRAQSVYRCYGQRADCLAPIRQLLPPGTHTVGFLTVGDDPETPLWVPFGSRGVRHIIPTTDLSSRDFDYIIANPSTPTYRSNIPFSEWLKSVNGTVVGSAELSVAVQRGVETWHLVRLPAKQ